MRRDTKRAYYISEQFRKRGKKVVMGGYHVTLCPDEVREHCDAIMVNNCGDNMKLLLEDVRKGSAMLFTFIEGGTKKLVVEVISSKSSPYKVRNDCRKQGVAYLRYYYDYDGWWNTKSYVTRRTSKALGLG